VSEAYLAAECAFDPAMGRSLEAAHAWTVLKFVSSLQRHCPQVGATALSLAGGHAIYAGRSPFSFAVGVGLGSGLNLYEIDLLEAFFRDHRCIPRVDVTPFTHPMLVDELRRRGYRAETWTSVLFRALAKELSPRLNEDPAVQVRWAVPTECSAWVAIMAKGFIIGEPSLERRASISAFFHAPSSMNVMATVQGEVAGVAGGMLPQADGIAPLFGASVLPQFRRRGLHGQMLRLRLKAARDAGCRYAITTATPGSDSERNLMRHGFTCAYQKVTWGKASGRSHDA